MLTHEAIRYFISLYKIGHSTWYQS